MLGSGGFGAVYRGRLHGEEVAIKRLHPGIGSHLTQEQIAEFQKEAANLQALRHPRLIRFIGVALEPPVLCMVTEARGSSFQCCCCCGCCCCCCCCCCCWCCCCWWW
ncbi:unnamed protein product [Polarella glacialis]|uniref:Protein kinase domain-containing protein n=1 Tax=Polarella glacialis TaxID=89957 RepID=A0A813F347_POLGL|nr:unnamed protein product [Polarella glacialis]